MRVSWLKIYIYIYIIWPYVKRKNRLLQYTYLIANNVHVDMWLFDQCWWPVIEGVLWKIFCMNKKKSVYAHVKLYSTLCYLIIRQLIFVNVTPCNITPQRHLNAIFSVISYKERHRCQLKFLLCNIPVLCSYKTKPQRAHWDTDSGI